MADEDTDMMSMDMSSYQKWEHGMIEDISHDTDSIIRMLGSDKMGESYDSGMLAGLLSNKGIDPGILALMDKGGFGGESGMLFLLFLVILMDNGGWGNNGLGNVDRTVINEGNFNQLMTAITSSGQAQTAAVQSLAQTLNTDVSAISSALASVDKQIAVNNGSITNAIQSCCCQMRTGLLEQTNQLNMGFNGLQNQASQIAYAQQDNATRNTQSIINAITQQSAMIQENFCEIRNREDAKTIQDLRDKLAEQRDASNLQLILAAIQNKDTIQTTIQGVLDTTAGTWSGTGTGSLSRIQGPIPVESPGQSEADVADSDPDFSDWSGMFPRGPVGGLKPLTISEAIGMAYDNIMKALSKPGEGLTTKQQSDNYEMFSKMMKENIYLPDLVQRISTLESKIEEMSKPKQNPVDAQLFAVMEQSVRDEPEVVSARRRLQDEKTRIISDMCMSNEAYRRLFDEYKTAVNSAYISKKEVKSDRVGQIFLKTMPMESAWQFPLLLRKLGQGRRANTSRTRIWLASNPTSTRWPRSTGSRPRRSRPRRGLVNSWRRMRRRSRTRSSSSQT